MFWIRVLEGGRIRNSWAGCLAGGMVGGNAVVRKCLGMNTKDVVLIQASQ